VFEKLRRDSTSVCVRRLCKECRVEESFEDSKEKLRRVSVLIRAAKLK
jgi:hypothetical protein